MPLAGVLATDELAGAFRPGDHFTTFGPNNQLGLRAANTVLDILDEERLPDRAAVLGERMLSGLRDLQRRHEPIGDVRGRGLMIGVEIVRDRETKEPDPDRCRTIRETLAGQGILMAVTGVHNAVLRITPPLVIGDDDIDRALETLDAALQER